MSFRFFSSKSPTLTLFFRHLCSFWHLYLFFLFWISYFAVFWSNAIWLDEVGNLIVGHINMWGDWAVHFTMGSSMAYKQLLPSSSPLLLGESFTYPFGANFISAVLIRLGMPFFTAFLFPSFLGSLAIVFLLYVLYLQVFRSSATAVIAATLFLLNGGLGFTNFIRDVSNAPEPMQVLLHPEKTYSGDAEKNIRWVSVIETMIIPQRAFAIGFPIALSVLVGFFPLFLERKKSTNLLNSKQKWLWIGLIVSSLGILPIFHAHSFLSVVVVLFFWGISAIAQSTHKSLTIRGLVITAVMSAVLATPLLFAFVLGNSTTSFQEWFPGWYAKETGENLLAFWIKNWSITPILAISGYFFTVRTEKKHKLSIILLFAPFFLLFILANLIKLQPFLWDNTKIIAWSSVGFSGLAAYALVQLYQKISDRVGKRVATTVVALLFLSMTLTAGIDTYRILRVSDHSYQMYSADDLLLANWVHQNTDPQSVWLTADNHNNWLYNLTGRQPIMAYRGWLWTHGYSYERHELLVKNLYAHPEKTADFSAAGIQYVVVGPAEEYDWKASSALFSQYFEPVFRSEQTTIFKVP